MICDYCNYEWESRKNNPKACPRCKRRFDYHLIKIEGEKNGCKHKKSN